MEKTPIALIVNGEPHDVAFDPYKTLLEVLREDLNLPGTKEINPSLPVSRSNVRLLGHGSALLS